MSEYNTSMYQYCLDIVNNDSLRTKYNYWFLLPAVAIITMLCFAEKRKNIKPDLFRGRPALARPLGFLDEPRNRWGVMFVFGSVTGNIIHVTLRTLTEELKWPIWAKIFLVYIQCLKTSVICYPLFSCMTSRHKLVGAITGLLYSIGWFIFELFIIIQIGRCYVTLNDPDVNVNMAAHLIIQEMPLIICNFLVMLKFCWKLFKCFKKGVYKISHEEQVKLCKNYHMTYVKHLLNGHNTEDNAESLTWKQTIQRKIVRPVPGFRFPISIMITTFMSGVMLYMVGLGFAELMEVTAKKYLKEFVDLITAANVIATIITIVCGLRNIYLLLMNYRRDMLLLYKGDRSFIPSTVQTPSPNIYMAQGMRFIGTSITGMLWGTVVCFLVVSVPLEAMMIVIRLLNERGKLEHIWTQFQWLIYPACTITIFKVQTFLVGKCFVQPKINKEDKYRPLAVDNRNAFDVFSFFMIFLNASIGIFAFLKRTLIGAFLGIFLIPRMDCSLLFRGYEAMDKCYVNYIGMLMVEVAHNHPVMRVFCFLVKSEVENKRDREPLQTAVENAEYGHIGFYPHIPVETTNSIAKRRWMLALSMIRNPSLVPLRVRVAKFQSPRSTLELSQIQCDDKTAIVDQDLSEDTWGFSIKCCKNHKFKIPPNIVTNIMALIVLLSVLVLYAGVQLFKND